MDNNRLPKHALNYKPEDKEIVDAPGKVGKASMPEQVKRPNPWKKMTMMNNYDDEDGSYDNGRGGDNNNR